MEKLEKEKDRLVLERRELLSAIEMLQFQLKEANITPFIDTNFSYIDYKSEKQQCHYDIWQNIEKLRLLIHGAGLEQHDYGRLLYLHQTSGLELLNEFFSNRIQLFMESGLLTYNLKGGYELNLSDVRNQKVLHLINTTERLIIFYESTMSLLMKSMT